MNELIKELVAQSGFGVRQNEVYTSKLEHLPITENIQKFAELIVEECAKICLDRHDTWRWDDGPYSDSGPRDCARSIKEHFGVEE